MQRLAIVVTAIAVLSVGCKDQHILQPPASAGPAYMISDGAHLGNHFFFFLPPLAPDPGTFFHAGTFNPKLSPVVEVCTLAGDPSSGSPVDCMMSGGNPVLVFGPAAMALDLTNEQYTRNWDTKSPTLLDPTLFYRIIVRGAAGGTALGFLDVDPVDQGMKNLKSGEVVPFQDGRTLPIKVRIENRAFCESVGTDCATATVGTAGGTVLADRAGVLFPPGVLPGDRVVIVEQVILKEGERCLSNKGDLLEYPPCYRFRTDPGPTPFSAPFAIASVCPDLSVFPNYTRFRELFQDDQENGLPDANADFLPCTLGTKNAFKGGWRGLLARLVDLVTPRPVFAATAVIDEGAGGVTPGFSRFVNAVRPRIEIVAGQGQTAISGTELPVNPTVRVTATHFDRRLFESPPPLAGVSVAFAPSGDGVVGLQPVTTDANGRAAATWKLATVAGGNTLSASARARGSPVMFTATGLGLVSLDAGDRESCYVASNGKAYCWGSNSFGQLGNGGTSDANVPTAVSGGAVFGVISTTFNYSCALGSDGRASCWGQNRSGRLGDGTTTDRSTPLPVSGGLTFTSISTGGIHSCGLTAGGVAYCWGDNVFGQLGSTSVETCPDPFGGIVRACSTVPVAVSGELTFKAITAGFFHTCGLRDDGAAFCWGRGIFGNLGTGTRTNAPAPVPVTGGLTFESLAAGAEYTCGLVAGGAAYCWGNNAGGQLGFGPPRFGPAVPTAVSEEISFVSLSVANENNVFGHTCGIAVGGAAYCWGGDLAGEIGAPTSETCPGFGPDAPHPCSTSPLPVSGGLLFRAIAEGVDHTCAIAVSGAAYCWGGNNRGQLGNGTTTASSPPVLVSNPTFGVP